MRRHLFFCWFSLVSCKGPDVSDVPKEPDPVTDTDSPPTPPTPTTDTTTEPAPEDCAPAVLPACTAEAPPTCGAVPQAAREVFRERCATCHGPGSPPADGFTNLLDPVQLIEGGWVVPGDAVASELFAALNGDMPPVMGGGPLTPSEMAIVTQWVDCGAESWGNGSTRGFVSPAMEYRAAWNDVRNMEVEDDFEPSQRGSRFLSLVPLYNAGVPAEDIELYASGLTKLVWSLTSEGNPPALVPIDLEGVNLDGAVVRITEGLGESLLFRVDIAQLGWADAAVDVWEEVVKAYPFAVGYCNDYAARELSQATRSRVPIVHADWFAANAARPPLYYDVLDMPATLVDFMLQFGGIVDQDDVDCAGLAGATSVLSAYDRVLCRQDSVDGYCWRAFDHATAVGQDDIFTNPVSFFGAADGGEAFCALGSGLQVYLAHDAAGNRIDSALVNLIADPVTGGAIETGVACMGCHATGPIPVVDEVLAASLGNPNLSDLVLDEVLETYPPADDLADEFTDDLEQFGRSLDDLGLSGLEEEPIAALVAAHDASSDPVRVAADLGITAAELACRLEGAAVAPSFEPLYTTGVMEREGVDLVARDTICELALGLACHPEDFCGAPAVPCLANATCDALGQCVE